MTEYFQTFEGEPDYCDAFLGLTVPGGERDSPREAYCDGCEERHRFVPVDD